MGNFNHALKFESLTESRKHVEPSRFRQVIGVAEEAAKNLKKSEVKLISALQAVDRIKAHRLVGFNSLYNFALKGLKLSEAQAYQYITVARKSEVFPELKAALVAQEITVSKAQRICSVIESGNQSQWLSLAKNLSKRELEKEVAKVNPRTRVQEGTTFISDTELEMRLTISEQGLTELEKVRSLLNQKNKKHLSLEEVIVELSKFYLDKQDPVAKAKRAEARRIKNINLSSARGKDISEAPNIPLTKSLKFQTQSQLSRSRISQAQNQLAISLDFPTQNQPARSLNYQVQTQLTGSLISQTQNQLAISLDSHINHRQLCPGRANRVQLMRKPFSGGRKAIPTKNLHQVHLRDQRQCQYIINGELICAENQWLDIHHIVPLSCGGTDSIENLVTLCKGHHRITHERIIQ